MKSGIKNDMLMAFAALVKRLDFYRKLAVYRLNQTYIRVAGRHYIQDVKKKVIEL